MTSGEAKTFQQLCGAARAQIPALTGLWTDHNPSDTGIMLLELLAAMMEQQNFYQDQVGPRFLERYWQLMGGSAQTPPSAQQWAEEFTRIWVAVTPEDYERLLLQASFGLDQAHAYPRDGVLVVEVFRSGSPLTDADLLSIRRYLEDYRLIGTRLRVVQRAHTPTDVACTLRFDPSCGRADVCRARVAEVFARAMRSQEQPLNKGAFTLELLAIPGVVGVEQIQLSSQHMRTSGTLWQADAQPTLGAVSVTLCDIERKGHLE